MSYYEWVKTFRELETALMDENIIKKLETATLDGNDYVLERLVDHVIKTINTRLNNRYNRCNAQIISNNINIDNLSLELIDVQKEKQFIMKIVSLPIFTHTLTNTFQDVINKRFDETYNALRKNLEYIDHTGQYISTFDKIISCNMEG